ncbi:MAG: hypothetical protein NZM09_03415 [Ignavibacterium sp.]|nr:hypothetical protein [Ignavibacterium sp.]MDW8374728.1 hypothetical protein [Ignavibacteriales bacterium]
MQNLLDLLGSFFIGGILLLMIMDFNLYTMSTSISSDKELVIHQNAKTLAEILSNDLRKIGYNYNGVSFISVDSHSVKYYADLQPPGSSGHGQIDIVEYKVIAENQNKLNLIRIINSKDTLRGPNLGISKFKFSYFDRFGNPTTMLNNIKYIRAEFWILPTIKFNNVFITPKDSTFTYWELTISPRNL